MLVFGSFIVIYMCFVGFDSGFRVALPFLNIHGVMGFILGLALDCQKVLDLGEVVTGKSPRLGVQMVIFGKPSIGGWR